MIAEHLIHPIGVHRVQGTHVADPDATRQTRVHVLEVMNMDGSIDVKGIGDHDRLRIQRRRLPTWRERMAPGKTPRGRKCQIGPVGRIHGQPHLFSGDASGRLSNRALGVRTT